MIVLRVIGVVILSLILFVLVRCAVDTFIVFNTKTKGDEIIVVKNKKVKGNMVGFDDGEWVSKAGVGLSCAIESCISLIILIIIVVIIRL